ncbi:MAG: hypothetical protein M1836_005514 [Candelina mexicana]|nr:MAG: hypothetical protein M1836_005514 [Candelina mexicana]
MIFLLLLLLRIFTTLPFSSATNLSHHRRSPLPADNPQSPIEIHCQDNGKASLPSAGWFPNWPYHVNRDSFANLNDLCYVHPIHNCGCRCVPNYGTTNANWASAGWRVDCSIANGGDAALLMPWTLGQNGPCNECLAGCTCTSSEEPDSFGNALNPWAQEFVPGRGKGKRVVYCVTGGEACAEGGSCEAVGKGNDVGSSVEMLWGLAKGVIVNGLGSCVEKG